MLTVQNSGAIVGAVGDNEMKTELIAVRTNAAILIQAVHYDNRAILTIGKEITEEIARELVKLGRCSPCDPKHKAA